MQVEEITIFDVLRKIQHIQDIKLLFLQDAFFEGKDVYIKNIINRNTVIRIIKKYPNHYKNLIINDNTIVIKNLCKLSFLRVGLEKEMLRFMEPYFIDDIY